MYKAEKNAQEYQRHPYADEGDADVSADLDVLTIPDEDTFQSLLNTLTPQLASTYLLHQLEKLTFHILNKDCVSTLGSTKNDKKSVNLVI